MALLLEIFMNFVVGFLEGFIVPMFFITIIIKDQNIV